MKDRTARPNVIVVVSDDHGYGDLSCMGATDFRTPHLDELARSGARFTSFYANAPVCSPSRASLLTGRYPARAGVRHILMSLRDAPGLPPGMPTLASELRRRGYRTCLVGKWHLGFAEGSRPLDHGFDEWFGLLGGAHDYYSHLIWSAVNREVTVGGRRGRGFLMHDLWDGENEVWHDGRYSTELFGERAVDVVRRAASDRVPFFLYLGFTAPHHPMHAPEMYKDRFRHLPPDRQIMAAMVSALDDQIGALRAEVDRQGIAEDTLVFFMSDNGPSRQSRNWLDGRLDPYYGGSTGHLKGHKFSLFEGGIRVPALISWPARIPAGRVVEAAAAGMDILPTVMAALGEDAGDLGVDGVDLLPVVIEERPAPARTIFWEAGIQTAARDGDLKLVLNGQLVDDEPPQPEVFLADLAADPGERVNLADERPAELEALRRRTEQWRAEIEEHWAATHAARYEGPNRYTVVDSSAMRVYDDPSNPAIGDT